MKKELMICAVLLGALSTHGNILINADFSAVPPDSNWAVFAGNPQPVANFVSFSGSVATLSGAANGVETNFYQGFGGAEANAALPAGVTYTFTADVSNITLDGGASAVMFVKAFAPGYAWIGGEFQGPALVEGTNTLTFTTTGVGDNIYQVGWFITGASGGSSIQITNPSLTVVPEPATYALILGALGLGVVILRRRRKA